MDRKQLISSVLDIAECLMAGGAEIHRVEETMTRILTAYGAVKTDVFVITLSMVVTVTFEDGETYTMSRRTSYSGGADFEKLEKLNDLSHEICAEPLPLDDLKRKISDIKSSKPSKLITYPGAFFGSGAFAVFFGGSILDGLIAGAIALIVCIIAYLTDKISSNKSMQTFLSSIVGALIVYSCGILIPIIHVDKVAIGVVMLLIPGIALTNAFRDLMVGDTVSGALRTIQTVIWASLIAAGFMLTMKVMNVPLVRHPSPDCWIQIAAAVIGALGFAMMFNLKKRYLPLTCAGGALVWTVFLVCELVFGIHVFFCTFIAAFIGEFYCRVLARILKKPTTIFLSPVVIGLIPGSSLYYTATSVILGDSAGFGKYGINTLLIAIGIALGVGISTNISMKILKNKHKAEVQK